jgi:hypothetical protein
MTVPQMVIPGGFVFDRSIGRYRGAGGRLISRAQVRRAIDVAIRNADNMAKSLADQYRKGEISLGRWEREMRTLIKNTHTLNAAAAKGGFDQLTQSDYGRIGRIVRDEYNHLDGFAGELAAGFQRPDGRMNARAMLYTRSGRQTYEVTQRRVARDAGLTEEKSIIAPADHCQQCLDQAALGWQPLGSLVTPGSRTCLSNCRCELIYR